MTIHVGDSVSWTIAGFHTVDLPARRRGRLALFTPQGTVSGANDPGGQPFWFNARPLLLFNTALQGASGPKSYDGSRAANSGLPLGPPKPFTVRFPKAGTFKYFCDVHPGMDGTVEVVRRRVRVPSRREDAWALGRQASRDIAEAKRLVNDARRAKGGREVSLGLSAPHGVEWFGFAPGNLTVARGTTVTFKMPRGSSDVHTATVGASPEKRGTYLASLAGSLQSPMADPAALYPSDPPGTTVSVTKTTHGNGFWNSGLLDSAGATPLPSAARARFTQAGVYNYYCLIHPFMHGKITVR